MENLIIKTIWIFLPAACANMAPVIFKRLPFLDFPVDFNLKLRREPILGRNKTWRGYFVGIIFAIIITHFQKVFYPETKFLCALDYSQINIWIFGFLSGFGALAGDSVKSFFKRRFRIAPGKSWIPFDQLDWIIGANFFISFYIIIEAKYITTSLILLAILHPLINYFGYKLNLKENKF